MRSSEELQLVVRARQGDGSSFAGLWALHRRWLGAVLLAHLPAGAELEDLAQDVALRAWGALGQLEDPERLRPWLRSIAMNVVRDAARRNAVRERTIRPLVPESHELSVEVSEHREAVEQVLRLLRGLPPEYREPLVLRAVDGMSQREIAATLELSESAVETRLARARRMLRERATYEDEAIEKPTPRRMAR